MTATTLRAGGRAPDPHDERPPRPRWVRRWPGRLAGLSVLAAASAAVRWGGRELSLWVDEGISVGLASHGLGEIPALLSGDGSPPLYFVLLHLWMRLFGPSEVSVRALSLVLAVVAVPVAFWAARRLFGQRAGWMAATLAAFSSYLTLASRDARMYPLLVVVALVAVSAFVQVLVQRRRAMTTILALALAAVAYTHNWGLFLVAALALAVPVCLRATERGARRAVALDAALAFGGATLVYLPWVPTLAGQVRRTGAPWSRTPGTGDIAAAVHSVLGSPWVSLVLAAVLGGVVLGHRRRAWSGQAVAAAVLSGVATATLALAWLSSQVEPAWSARYFGALLAPVLLVSALALARAGRAGVLALVAVVAMWTLPTIGPWSATSAPAPKSNVRSLAGALAPVLGPGDVVMTTQFEQLPLFAYYLGTGLRYAEPSGVVADPLAADWRHAKERLAAADPAAVLDQEVERLRRGGHVVIACPRLFTDASDLAWYRLMDTNCVAALNALAGHPEMVRVWGPWPPRWVDEEGASMAVTLYRRAGAGAGP
ncbi:MAG TPA: glycosyltransferase family 39 protein [Acidimicrobiales bacterium]|nr:glycosyltransferase family 39 protein [Acidimicrobiales bacterium]